MHSKRTLVFVRIYRTVAVELLNVKHSVIFRSTRSYAEAPQICSDHREALSLALHPRYTGLL
jgi:hypothetical protein